MWRLMSEARRLLLEKKEQWGEVCVLLLPS